MCNVNGAKLLSAPMSQSEVCTRVRRGVDKALATRSRPVTALPASDWVKVDIRFAKPGIAAATISRKKQGAAKTYPVIEVAVMDRPLDGWAVDRLISEVTRILASDGR